MKKLSFTVALLAAAFVFTLTGCKDKVTSAEDIPATDAEAISQLVGEDSSTVSLEENYAEEDAFGFSLGKEQAAIYPVKAGRKITSVTRSITQQRTGDTITASVATTFTGLLIIRASRVPVTPGDTTRIDTTIAKPFTAVINRKLIFIKFNNLPNPKRNWKLIAANLPSGGTVSAAIAIRKLVFRTATDTLTITNPEEYFLSRWWVTRHRQIPVLAKNQQVTVRVEVYSAYADTDFVSLTYGADLRGMYRIKKQFVLQSSTPEGSGYAKAYEQVFNVNQHPGYFHSVIDLLPRQVLFTDNAPVESKCWGVPYFVKN